METGWLLSQIRKIVQKQLHFYETKYNKGYLITTKTEKQIKTRSSGIIMFIVEMNEKEKKRRSILDHENITNALIWELIWNHPRNKIEKKQKYYFAIKLFSLSLSV